MTFESWLIRQKDRDDRIGDLAKDFMDGKKIWGDKKLTHDVLYKRNACKEAHETLDYAVEEYKLHKKYCQ